MNKAFFFFKICFNTQQIHLHYKYSTTMKLVVILIF